MNWAEAVTTVVMGLVTIFVVLWNSARTDGRSAERLEGHERRLESHSTTLKEHGITLNAHEVAIVKLEAWNDGYRAGKDRSDDHN